MEKILNIFAINILLNNHKEHICEINNIKNKNYKYFLFNNINTILLNKKTISFNDIIFLLNEEELFIDDSIDQYNNEYNQILIDLKKLYKEFNEIKFLTIDSVDYPKELKEKVFNSNTFDLIPPVLSYYGNIKLLNKDSKLGIVGTRNPQNFDKSEYIIKHIAKRKNDNVCLTGLASGIDSIAIHSFKESIAYVAEPLNKFLKKKERDVYRYNAKLKCMEQGLIISHIMPHDVFNRFSSKQYLLERNYFVALMSKSLIAVEYGIKSGTINTINHAIKNNIKVFTPHEFVNLDVKKKYENKIKFYNSLKT